MSEELYDVNADNTDITEDNFGGIELDEGTLGATAFWVGIGTLAGIALHKWVAPAMGKALEHARVGLIDLLSKKDREEIVFDAEETTTEETDK